MPAIAAVVACIASGFVWAFAAVVGGAALDQVPTNYYDAGNRFAFFVALMMLSVVCPLACLVAYGFARLMG
jgi:hypothetical protein